MQKLIDVNAYKRVTVIIALMTEVTKSIKRDNHCKSIQSST